MELSPGKIRGLQSASSQGGIFKILAIDHRDSLRVLVNLQSPDQVKPQTLTDLKLDIIQGLSNNATAVMLDPVYSAAQAIVSGVLPGMVGFLCALEAQGYSGQPTARQTTLLDGWSVAKAKRLGASGIKLLVYYHPYAGRATEVQEHTIRRVVTDCAQADIPLFLEPIYYSPDENISVNSPEFRQRRPDIVIDTVRRLSALGPDVLKIQFPFDSANTDQDRWRDACEALDAAASCPWALLSGGDPFDVFSRQLEVACKAGCSGFMAGRALWREAVNAPIQERMRVLKEVAKPRFDALGKIVEQYGSGWRRKVDTMMPDESWYLSY